MALLKDAERSFSDFLEKKDLKLTSQRRTILRQAMHDGHFSAEMLLDFSKKEDLKFLGTGKLIQQDGSVIKNIHLLEIDSYWIIYEKNSSSHDMMMDVISRIEFSDTKWGPLYLVFPNNKTESHRLNNYN